MALNIPVNLMSTAAPPASAAPASTAGVSEAGPPTIAPASTVQPTRESTDSQASAQDGNTGGQASSEQQSAANARPSSGPPSTSPDKAQTQSVVAAQTNETSEMLNAESLLNARDRAEHYQQDARTKALIESVSATSSQPSALLERTDKIDRYAPPVPIPTAPILKGEAPTAIKTSDS